MRNMQTSLRWLAATLFIWTVLGGASANAFETHNPVEPPLGPVAEVGSLAVDQSNGNVYASEITYQHEEIQVFGREGGSPTGGVPSSFTGAGSFNRSFIPTGVAVNPSNHHVYILDVDNHVIDKYALNGSHEYEYVCEFKSYGGGGNRCLVDGGERGAEEKGEETNTYMEFGDVALDSADDVYAAGRIGPREGAIFEFNAAGEAVHAFALPLPEAEGNAVFFSLTVWSSGTIYAQVTKSETGAKEVVEFRRSSLTGAVEGEPTVIPNTQEATGIAFDQANGQLFVDLGSSGEALNGAHEVVSRFGSGVIKGGGALAIDEATGEVYVANGTEQNIDRFGPGVPATLPAVDEPPPSVSDVTRTSALLSGTVSTGNATTTWQLEYVAAGEYQQTDANPYADGGRTATSKLGPAVVGDGIGPLPLTGLLAGTTYHYRLVATNEFGTTDGQDHTFTTASATPPLVTTGTAGEVTRTTATLSGTVGTRELQTSYAFEIGTDASYGGAKLFGNAGSGGTEAVSVSLQFLVPGVTYHYRLAATNQDGTSYGQDMTFTTPGVAAPIVQPPATPLLTAPIGKFPSLTGAITKPRSKPQTRAQKLARALKACAKKPRSKRAACRRARRV